MCPSAGTIKGIICVFIFLSVVIGSQGNSQEPLEVDVQKLSRRSIVLKVRGGNTNVIALDSAEGIVVFDTDVSPALAELIRKRIEREFGHDNFTYVINTHGHGDHTNGNSAFPEAQIIGHINVASEMEESAKQTPRTIAAIKAGMKRFEAAIEAAKDPEQAESLKTQKKYYEIMLAGLEEGRKPLPPSRTLTEKMVLNLGDMTLELIPFGLAHSRSDIVIHCPEEGLWVTGDLFFEGNDLYIDSERVPYMERWIAVMEKIAATEENTKFIVPGHESILPMDVIQKAFENVKARQAEFAGKESAFVLFKNHIESAGLGSALDKLRDMKSQPGRFYVLHPEIDQYAFRMMMDNRLEEALSIFKVLAEIFPDVSMAYDSLGEVYMRLDNKDMAIQSFEKSLELDAGNRNAVARLAELKKQLVIPEQKT